MNPISFLNPNFNKLYDTMKIEPLSLNNVHYANKVIYTTEGELVNVQDGGSVDISSVVNFVTINSSNCFLTQISVNETNLIGIAPITLECECVNFITDGNPKFPQGVIQSKNQIQASSSLEGVINYSRTISVNGGAASFSNPFGIVKGYALDLKNRISSFQLNFKGRNVRINNPPPILISESTSEDRYNAIVSIQQNYLMNLNSPYSSEKGIVKETIEEEKSFIDEVVTITKKISIEGGILKQSDNIEDILKNLNFKSRKNPGADFSIISKNISFDQERNSAEITIVFSNDPTISKNGNKISCTFNASLDFFTDNNNLNYLCQVQPISNISQSDSTFNDIVRIKSVKDLELNEINSINFIEFSQEESKRKGDKGAYGSAFSINFIDSSNGINGDFYEVDIQGNYTPGIPLYAETPILDGKGKWYLEDLNVFSNGTSSITINGKSKKIAAPKSAELLELTRSGDFCQGCKDILMQDQIYFDKLNGNFSYNYSKMGEDKDFYKAK